ncbi:MAG: AAA family ATPase [Eubacteriales bacterium]
MNQFYDPQKEMTTPSPSIGVDGEQSIHNNMDIVPQAEEESKRNRLKSTIENLVQMSKEKPYPKEEQLRSSLPNMTMTELFDTVFPPIQPMIENFLYPGTYILAGSPKVGKSFFVAQIAYHISMGLPFLGREVTQSNVLYLGLEDNYRRLQRRLFTMYGTECTENLRLSVSCEGLSTGLLNQLTDFLKVYPKNKVIILDTLQKVRGGTYEASNYANDYEIMSYFKDFADYHDVALIIIHHTRKLHSDDSFDMISGTNGLFGAVDGGLVLVKKERSGREATLQITSRDFADQKILVEKCPITCKLQYISDESDQENIPTDPVIRTIAEFITGENSHWEGSPSDLVKFLHLEKSPQALTRTLNANIGDLLTKFKISYHSKRKHEGRQISLTYLP